MKAIAFALILAPLPLLAQTDSASLIKKGDALDAQLKTAQALAAYKEAEKLDPNDAVVLQKLSREYALSMDDVQSEEEKRSLGLKALDYAKRAVAADPKNEQAQLSVAVCYGRLAPLMDNKTKISYSKLVKQYAESALALDKSDAYTYHVLGAWNYELANLNPILKTIARMIYGDIPSASNEDAVKYFQKAIELAPQRVGHHVELGRTYAAMGRKDLARTELNKGLELPNHEKDDPECKRRAREALEKL